MLLSLLSSSSHVVVVCAETDLVSQYGQSLKAGDFVITGATCILPPTDYSEGDLVVAEFKGLGSVTLTTGSAAGAKL
eukprot:SAG11_NODE_6487_length_1304_cov_1.034855_1_plen_77_part_00